MVVSFEGFAMHAIVSGFCSSQLAIVAVEIERKLAKEPKSPSEVRRRRQEKRKQIGFSKN